MKREGPALLAFVVGTIVLLGYFLKSPEIAKVSQQIVTWRTIVAAFALALGGVNMFRMHGRSVATRAKNWPYSLIFLVCFVGYFILGIATSPTSSAYQYIWSGLYQPAASTMYSFTLFYMTSACWRAFRIRNWQAGVLMVTGAIVLLGQVGIGQVLSPWIPKIASWLIQNPNSAAIRAITIGGSFGMVSVSLRIILGLERTYMSGGGQS